jgi:hypothetical protein
MAGGNISNSFATGNVSGTATIVGGLLGTSVTNTLTLRESSASGNVTGTGTLGGLVGSIADVSSLVELSYATGDVSGSGTYLGGLIGLNYAVLNKVYASGDVTNTSTATATNLYNGGLVGRHYTSSISDAFALGVMNISTSANHTQIGGLIGLTNASISEAISRVYFGGSLNGIGTPNTRQILIGSGGNLTNVSNAYWYADRAGYSGTVACGTNVACATAVTQTAVPTDFNDFDFENVWQMEPEVTLPYLRELPFNDKVNF